MKLLKKIKFILWIYWRIPRGPYCYKIKEVIYPEDNSFPRIKTKICPYWDIVEGGHYQENGFCHYLGRGDYDKNNDEDIIMQQIDKDGNVIAETPAPEMPFGIGLLWDQCKECGVKEFGWNEMWEWKIKPILFFWKKIK